MALHVAIISVAGTGTNQTRRAVDRRNDLTWDPFSIKYFHNEIELFALNNIRGSIFMRGSECYLSLATDVTGAYRTNMIEGCMLKFATFDKQDILLELVDVEWLKRPCNGYTLTKTLKLNPAFYDRIGSVSMGHGGGEFLKC